MGLFLSFLFWISLLLILFLVAIWVLVKRTFRWALRVALAQLNTRLPHFSSSIHSKWTFHVQNIHVQKSTFDYAPLSLLISVLSPSIHLELREQVEFTENLPPSIDSQHSLSWLIQLCSRYHPIWPLVHRFLPLIRPLLFLLTCIELRTSDFKLDIHFRPQSGQMPPLTVSLGTVSLSLKRDPSSLVLTLSLQIQPAPDAPLFTVGAAFLNLGKEGLSLAIDLPWPLKLEKEKDLTVLARPPLLPSAIHFFVLGDIQMTVHEADLLPLLAIVPPPALSSQTFSSLSSPPSDDIIEEHMKKFERDPVDFFMSHALMMTQYMILDIRVKGLLLEVQSAEEGELPLDLCLGETNIKTGNRIVEDVARFSTTLSISFTSARLTLAQRLTLLDTTNNSLELEAQVWEEEEVEGGGNALTASTKRRRMSLPISRLHYEICCACSIGSLTTSLNRQLLAQGAWLLRFAKWVPSGPVLALHHTPTVLLRGLFKVSSLDITYEDEDPSSLAYRHVLRLKSLECNVKEMENGVGPIVTPLVTLQVLGLQTDLHIWRGGQEEKDGMVLLPYMSFEDFGLHTQPLDGKEERPLQVVGSNLKLEWSPILVCFMRFAFARLVEAGFITPKLSTEDALGPPQEQVAVLSDTEVGRLLNAEGVSSMEVQGRISLIQVDFPYSKSQDLGDLTDEDAWQWIQARSRCPWASETVTVESAFFAASPSTPIKQWTFGVGKCQVTNSSSVHPYCTVEKFAIRQKDRVIDITSDGVGIIWTPLQQLRVMKVCQDITLSIWVALLEGRRAFYALPDIGEERNDDKLAKALQYYRSSASAQGKILHRLTARNINVSAYLPNCGALGHDVNIQLQVGLFGGDDLPNLWRFGGVYLTFQGHPMLSVSSLTLRRTLDRREDLVIGEVVHELRVRRKELGADQNWTEDLALKEILNGKEGLVIHVEGCSVRVCYDLPLAQILDPVFLEAMVLMEKVATLPAKWIPQADDFHRRFKRPFRISPSDADPQQIWLSSENLSLHLSDDPFEMWLDFVYPMWIQELNAQRMRYGQLVRHEDKVKRTSGATDVTEIHAALTQHLHEINSACYMRNMKETLKDFNPAESSLLSVTIGRIFADVSVLTEKETLAVMQTLDEDPAPPNAAWDVLVGASLSVSLQKMNVRIRRSEHDLLSANDISMAGKAVLAQPASPPSFYTEVHVHISPSLEGTVKRSHVPPHVYSQMEVRTKEVRVNYCPAFKCSLEEIAHALQYLIPPSLFIDPRELKHPLPFWDLLRRLIHVRVEVIGASTTLSFIPSFRTFTARELQAEDALYEDPFTKDSPVLKSSSSYQVSEQMKLQVSLFYISYVPTRTSLEAFGILGEQVPNPHNLPPFLEIPLVQIGVEFCWQCEGDPTAYRVYPILRRESAAPPAESEKDTDPFYFFRSRGVSLVLECSFPCKSDVEIHPLFPLIQEDAKLQSAFAMAQPTFSIMYYGISIPWLLRFLKVFVPAIRAPQVLKNGSVIVNILHSFRAHIRAVEVRSIVLHGLSICAYDTNPSDQARRGLRVSLTGKTNFSVVIAEEESVPNPFQCGRILLPGNTRPLWAARDVVLRVSPLEARICTAETGSRGEFLFSLASLDYLQFCKHPSDLSPSEAVSGRPGTEGGAEPTSEDRLRSLLSIFSIDPTEFRRKASLSPHPSVSPHPVSLSPRSTFDVASLGPDTPVFNIEPGSARSSLMSPVNREQSIIQEDAVLDENDYEIPLPPPPQEHFTAHVDSERFLHSLVVDGFKFMLTVHTLHALMELVEAYYNKVIESLPETVEAPTDPSVIHAKDEGGGAEQEKRSGIFDSGKFGVPEPLQLGKSRRPSLGDVLMRNVLSVEVNRTQIQLLDTDISKGCLILSIDYACIQGQVGLDPKFLTYAFQGDEPKLSASDRQNLLLQKLAERSLENYRESIMLNIRAVRAFVAPTDVDIGMGLQWLPDTAFRPSSGFEEKDKGYGLLRAVLDPLKVELDVLAIHEAALYHIIRMSLPDITFQFDTEQYHLLFNVAKQFMKTPVRELEQRANQKQTQRLKGQLLAPLNMPTTLPQIWALQKMIKWDMDGLKNLRSSLGTRQKFDFAQDTGARFPSPVDLASPLLSYRTKYDMYLEESFASMNDFSRSKFNTGVVDNINIRYDVELDAWLADIESRLLNLEAEEELLKNQLHVKVKEQKKGQKTKPNTELDWVVGGLAMKLKQLQKPFFVAGIQNIRGAFSSFEDESAEVHIVAQSLRAEDHRSQASSPTSPTLIVFPCAINRATRVSPPGLGMDGSTSANKAELGDDMLHIQANVGAPVGGMTVLQHFEVNCRPLTVRMNRGLVVQIHEFFEPADETDEEEDAVRAKFLVSPAETGAKTMLNQLLAKTGATTVEYKRGGGGGGGGGETSSLYGGLMDENSHSDVAVLKKRAKRNIVFKHFRLGEVNIFFSYSGAKWGNLEDVEHLHLKLHPLVYGTKTCSFKEFLLHVRKDVILDLLSQVTRNFSNLGAFINQSIATWNMVFDDEEDNTTTSSSNRNNIELESLDLPNNLQSPGVPTSTGSNNSSKRGEAGEEAGDERMLLFGKHGGGRAAEGQGKKGALGKISKFFTGIKKGS